MNRRSFLLGATLLGCSKVGYSPTGPSTNLLSEEIINTQPKLCDGGLHAYTWKNIGATRQVHRLRLWIGTDYGFRGDLAQGVYRMSDGRRLIASGGLDRYRDPGSEAENYITEDFGVNYIEIQSSDGIVLHISCGAITKEPANIHAALTMYWKDSV